MKLYSEAAMERAMKVQESDFTGDREQIPWWQAAEISVDQRPEHAALAVAVRTVRLRRAV